MFEINDYSRQNPAYRVTFFVIACISCGISAVISIFSFVIGWMKLTLYECNACLWIREEVEPYKVSPIIGWPNICWMHSNLMCSSSFKHKMNNAHIIIKLFNNIIVSNSILTVFLYTSFNNTFIFSCNLCIYSSRLLF